MKVSYEPRLSSLKTAVSKFACSYKVPLGLFLFIALAALYVFAAHRTSFSSLFPRSGQGAVSPARAGRRLAGLRERLAGNVRAMDFGDESWQMIAKQTMEVYRRVLARAD